MTSAPAGLGVAFQSPRFERGVGLRMAGAGSTGCLSLAALDLLEGWKNAGADLGDDIAFGFHYEAIVGVGAVQRYEGQVLRAVFQDVLVGCRCDLIAVRLRPRIRWAIGPA